MHKGFRNLVFARWNTNGRDDLIQKFKIVKSLTGMQASDVIAFAVICCEMGCRLKLRWSHCRLESRVRSFMNRVELLRNKSPESAVCRK